MPKSACPYCSSPQLLRHIRDNRIFWWCANCRREVPRLGEHVPSR